MASIGAVAEPTITGIETESQTEPNKKKKEFQGIGGNMPSDHDLVACEQDHEMMYILQIYGKAQTQSNLLDIRSKCRAFKQDYSYSPHNRANFYRYLENKYGWRKV